MRHVILSLLLALLLIQFQEGFAQATTSQNQPAIVLNHIALYVHNLEKSTDFYQNVLQLQTIPEPFKDGKHTWFTIGGNSQLHLIAGASEITEHDKNSHLCFSVKSVDEFIANLDKHQIDYTNWPGTAKAPTIRVDGVKQIYFQDPDGYWIEVNDDFPGR